MQMSAARTCTIKTLRVKKVLIYTSNRSFIVDLELDRIRSTREPQGVPHVIVESLPGEDNLETEPNSHEYYTLHNPL